jgi:hypothetical protein
VFTNHIQRTDTRWSRGSTSIRGPSLDCRKLERRVVKLDVRPSRFISHNPNNFAGRGSHWGRALLESFTFLSIEQAYVVHDDYRWVTSENCIPFNHYWRDYKQSLHTWVNSGWDDGDAVLYSYVGHPIQGALTEYIQIQNDPKGRDLERLQCESWDAKSRA